jgi:hypothetical protein
MTTTGKTPFVVADIVDPGATQATMRYGTGFNCSGTSHNEVLEYVRRPDGSEQAYVIMRGVSRAKAEAIAMILNAPELG